jgi:DNA-binding LytR/AlgR family response regulator
MGGGITSMHYLGMHAISGPFSMSHEGLHAIAAAVLAVGASYAALRLLEAKLGPWALAVSAVAFGLAVSGMHYTAMAGMALGPQAATRHAMGLAISSDILTVAVAVLAFFISGFFLLYLVPEGRRREAQSVAPPERVEAPANVSVDAPSAALSAVGSKSVTVPVETEGATRLIPCEAICAVQATTHYTLVYDGQKEYLSPWSITEAEQKLPPQDFIRVHRSHIVALDKISSLRRAGDGGAVEVGQPVPRVVPVSRSHYAELKSRLGLRQKIRSPGSGRPRDLPGV